MPLSFHLEWSQSLAAGLGGLSLARESGWFCAWDAQGWIYLFNSQGQRQGQVRFSEPLAQAALADDGSCLLAAGNAGKLRCYNPDLSTQWESDHKGGLLSLALDPLGQMAAVADRKGSLFLVNRAGKKVGQAQSPRPLHHLALVPTVKRLVGAADFGLLAGFDEAAQILWRETPVVHVGGLAVDATGDKILLACFSEGVAWFGGDGKLRKNFATPAPCGKVCQSFAGDVILAGGFGNQVMILNGEGALLGQHQLAHTIQATALGPLGRELYAALSDGTVVKYRL